MANLPRATTTLSEAAGAQASGTDLVCILAPCVGIVPDSEGKIPIMRFGTAKALLDEFGYSEGVEYAALHIAKTKKPVLFGALPIATAGVVGSVDTTGNTGTAAIAVAASANGVMTDHQGSVRVVRGGLVGVDQILLEISADNERSWQQVRLGTGQTYGVPYLGADLFLKSGTLVAGDTIIRWVGRGPRSNAVGWAAARSSLASQPRFFRTVVLCGDLVDATEANAFKAEIDAYASENERFIQARAQVPDRLPLGKMTRNTWRKQGTPSLTFAVTANTITRDTGSWLDDGFVIGDWVTVTGTASNNVSGFISALSATVLTIGAVLANETTSAATVIGSMGLLFAEVGVTGDTITRNRGSWISDGFRVGDTITVGPGPDGTPLNNGVTGVLAGVSATVLTFGSTDLQVEGQNSRTVTINVVKSKAAAIAAADATFETVNGSCLSLSYGRGAVTSPLTGWAFRRCPGWAASVREFSPGDRLHVPTWRKSDGDTGFMLHDANNVLIEHDDRVDGGAACGARFTSFRTYGNNTGAYIALDLTRAPDGSLQTHEANMNVINLAMQTVQNITETAAIGAVLVLNPDGTATEDSLGVISGIVNAAVQGVLLPNRGEGPRCSLVVWTPDPDVDYRVPAPVMVGTLDITLNGIVHSVETVVRINTPGSN